MKHDMISSRKKLVSKLSALMILPILLSGCHNSNTSLRPDETMVLKVATSETSVDTGAFENPWSLISFHTSRLFRNLFLANAGTGEIGMDLAESYTISNDGLVYEIILKEGVVWSDGEALTLDDVVFSIESSIFTSQPYTLFITSFAGIQGAREFMQNPDTVEGISGLVVDGNKLTITLETPNHLFLDALSQFAILPQHILKDEDMATLEYSDFWSNIVGCGMYKIGDHVLGEYLEFVYNDLYAGPVPYINTIRLYSDYEFGELDYYETSNIAEILDYRAVLNMSEHVVHNLFYRYFVFNIDKGGEIDPVLSDIRVRQDLTYAINRDALLRTIYYSTADIINTGVVSDYNEPLDVDYPYNPERAKQLLAEAEYDFDRPIELLHYYTDDISIAFMEEVAKYLEAVGLTVNLVGNGNVFTEEFDTYDMGLKGLAAYSNLDWYNEYLSTSQLHSDIFGGEPMFDERILELSATTNTEELNVILHELQELEYELLYKYPIFTLGHYIYINNNVEIPDDIAFDDSKYKYDIQIEEWKISSEPESKKSINAAVIIIGLLIFAKLLSKVIKEVKADKKLSEKMYIDAVTGIYNRAKCQEILKLPPLPENSKKDRAIVIFDLNDLKKTNDKFGHRAGDQLIHHFAKQLEDASHASTNEIFVGRYGGDEFIAFLDETEEQDVKNFIAKVDELMDIFNKTENTAYKLSCAVGYAITTTMTKTMSVKELFDIADENMYKNKIDMKQKKNQASPEKTEDTH